MSIKAAFAIPFAKFVQKKVQKWEQNPIKTQERVFQNLIFEAKNTAFGKDHQFASISNYEDFKSKVPVVEYEALRPYVERVIAGENDVLWKGRPLYFAKTSGTTSGAKYIPITKESMPTHIKSARNAMLLYIAETGDTSFVDGKMIFLQGSPVLEDQKGIKLGRLSGIVAHYVPKYLLKNRLPSWETNCIQDWETKVDAIVEETLQEDMTVISGIPSWVQMYFEKLYEKTGKTVSELFPKFNFFIYGGVNFEFIPANEFHEENPTRVSLKDVQLGVNYVIILNTTAGLWGYNIGDTVEFTSLAPYRVKVTGRIKHFISAFGEHVIGKEVDQALKDAVKGTDVVISEFTVAPQVEPENGLPYHEWFVEFEKEPEDLESFAAEIDASLQTQNIYYFDLIEGKVLRPLLIRKVAKGGFHAYMKSIGKFGGQNKIPQLSDNRKIAQVLETFVEA